ncbi:trihelix transcription factor GT-2-like [Abrus precatorius]|uniref:Trihelix transcription factor GT-2-like n=1 Tax=Abrus precatorius TaxID=3816 RepID=A0A8B8M6D1_ABRPR|nr:trihelix transcription factor GT-2-like [Abrus precatorius]
MLEDSAVLGGGGGGSEGGASGDAVAATGGGGGVGSNSGDDEKGRIEEGERSFGGNRWPREETLALLRIRSDMDVAFRDASVKGPLWEEVSRKMAEHGYHRSSKKCKEKFENVYKYHKRTKEGRSGKSDGKTYRFFDQLEALENHPPTSHSPNPSSKPQPLSTRVVAATTTVSLPTTSTSPPTTVPMLPVSNTTLTTSVPHVTVPSTTTLPIAMPQGIVTAPSINLTNPSYLPTNPTNFPPPSTANPTTNATPPSFPADTFSNSSSSSTSSDETLEGRRKRKRKWKDFFERLMKEVIEKQEDLQKRFLEAIEKREHERMVREESWRVQEMQRINTEREILAQERSIAAAKDAAVMSFLQKIAEQQNLGQALSNINIVQAQAQAVSQPQSNAAAAPVQQQPPPVVAQPVVLPVVPQQQVTNMEIVKADNNGENFMPASSSRWPKVEVQALIKLRTSLDAKYQENGPKGPLWEEISNSMKKLGYNRNPKRCKEKWENINKYFKKVKESNKKRPEDSKTCPYFQQLDALYREKNKLENQQVPKPPDSTVAPLMVRPEQQWPPQHDLMREREVTMQDVENEEDDEEEEREGEEEEDDEEDEEGGGGGGGGNYEIVANKNNASSVGASAE